MTKTRVRAENEYFVVEYVDEEKGLNLQTGYFKTEETAVERASVLETLEDIKYEDLAGDVAE
jgi:hypothetical protein